MLQENPQEWKAEYLAVDVKKRIRKNGHVNYTIECESVSELCFFPPSIYV